MVVCTNHVYLSMSFAVAFHEVYPFRVVEAMKFLQKISYEPRLVLSRVHYKHFVRYTFWVVVKCLGELLMSPNFQSTSTKILKKRGFVQTTFSLPPSIALVFHEVLFQGCYEAMKLPQK
jgi:hypothetical protein